MTIIWLIWWLIVAHVLADWCWQGRWMAENKGKYWIVMLAHCVAWAGVLSIPLAVFGVLAIWKIFFLVGGHYVVDMWKDKKYEGKVTCQEMPIEKFLKYVYIDQLLHLLQIIVVACL